MPGRRVKSITITQAVAQAYRLFVRPSCTMKVGIDYAFKSPSWSIFDGHEYFSYFIERMLQEETKFINNSYSQ